MSDPDEKIIENLDLLMDLDLLTESKDLDLIEDLDAVESSNEDKKAEPNETP